MLALQLGEHSLFYNPCSCLTFSESYLFFGLRWGKGRSVSFFRNISSCVVSTVWRNWLKKFWCLELVSWLPADQNQLVPVQTSYVPLSWHNFCQCFFTLTVFILEIVEPQKQALCMHPKISWKFWWYLVCMAINPTNWRSSCKKALSLVQITTCYYRKLSSTWRAKVSAKSHHRALGGFLKDLHLRPLIKTGS